MEDVKHLIEKARQLRIDVLNMTTKAGTGHVTSSFSCTELLVALYYAGIMKYDPKNYNWSGRDYFIFSKGHANPILYCILADLGFFPREELDSFCQSGGKFGVLLKADVPGAEIVAGSLGCGLGIAAGLAQAFRIDKKNNKVFCMVGDGECRQGAIWESAMHVGFQKLTNLITIVDRNHLACTHFTEEEAGVEPLKEKWEACGFEAICINGHSFYEILSVLGNLDNRKNDKPLAVIADTIKGKGVSFIENQPLMHGAAVRPEDLERAIVEIKRGLII